MAFDQHALPAIGLTLDVREYDALAKRISYSGRGISEQVSAAVHAYAKRIRKGARANLSGAVLHVQTGRLRGALAADYYWLGAELENDVFYGVLWEEGIPRADGSLDQRAWFGPAVEEAGGEAGFVRAIETALHDATQEAIGHDG